MRKNKKILILAFLALIIFAVYPNSSSAQQIGQQTPLSSQNGGIVPCGGPADPCTLCHLVVGIHNLVQTGIYWVLTFAIVGIFISGVMYIISSGDEGMITKAKGFMKACLIGFVVVAGAWMIINTALQVLSAKDSNGDGYSDFGIASSGSWFAFTCSTNSSVNSATGPAVAPPPSGSAAPLGIGDPCTGMYTGLGARSGSCRTLSGTGGSSTDTRVCPNRSWRMEQATSWPQCPTGAGCCDMSAANTNTAPGILYTPCGASRAGTCTRVTGTFVSGLTACGSIGKVSVSGGTPPFDSCLSGLWCCASPGSGSPSPPPSIGP